MSKITLGIDMGGTGIKLGLVNAEGQLLNTLKLLTPIKSNPEEIAAVVAEQARALLHLAGRSQVLGIGVGCAGDVDPVKGVIRISPNLRWKDVSLKKLLSRHL